jgi:diguanylate cyclase (GGDEF)-like protein/PAS domain S-box-containing protein
MEDERKSKKQLIEELNALRLEQIEQTKINSEKFTKAFRQNSIPMTIATVKDGRFVDASDAFLRLVERKRDKVIGYTSRETGFITEEQRSFIYNELSKNGRIENLEMEVQPKGIGSRYGLFNFVMISFNNENYLLTTIQDITDRKLVEVALQKSEERYRSLVENTNEAILVIQEGMIKFVNSQTVAAFGYSEQELMFINVFELIHPEDRDLVMERYLQKINGDTMSTRHTYRTIHKSGQTQWIENSSVLIDWEGRPATLNLITDITERKQMEKALRESEERYRELSIIDDLTQLYNSRHFYFQLKIELERSNRYKQPLTLLLFDIDNFKAFNDTYGHVEGDHVLRRLGQVVKRCLRETDLAFRYGGEEFTIILPMTTSADGSVTAERIRTEFKKENFSPAPGQEFYLTVSIGLSQYKPKEDIKAFVHRVDQLMYQAKKNGKDRVCLES